MYELNGEARITNEGIKKHFKSLEPFKAIFELVWNGFDAEAKNIRIDLIRNDLEALKLINVLDDGKGIALDNLENSFKKFNESNKKNSIEKHGSHGRGRLAFYRLCQQATWFTRWTGHDIKLTIDADTISKFSGTELSKDDQHPSLSHLPSGTIVELNDLYAENSFPTDENFISSLSNEFSWLCILDPEKNIYINNSKLMLAEHTLYTKDIEIEDIVFTIKVIHWKEKQTSEKSYNYLVNSKNELIAKELSKTNNKVSFYTSCYGYSEWLDTYNNEILELDDQMDFQSKIVSKIHKEMSDFQRSIYKEYLKSYVDAKIESFEKNGYFPSYIGVPKQFAIWRKENTKEAIKQIYLADPSLFTQLKSKPLKVLIRLLDRLLISNENDAIYEILDGVLDLNESNIEKLTAQLKITTFENIISTIEVLQKREIAVSKLKELMDRHYENILETPDLQKIIENNTWLFGPKYEILGAEEDSFTRTAKSLRSLIKDIDIIDPTDVEDGKIDGINRQVDLFLARKNATVDTLGNRIYKCVIVEIKKPSISLNKKHYLQLQDYMEIIAKHPSFSDPKLHFELILIGRKISKDDIVINTQLESLKDKGEVGLVINTPRIKCYVKGWYSIFNEFSLSNDYLLENLKSKLSDLSNVSKDELVTSLQN